MAPPPLLDEDVIACARIVERGDPDRFRATMAAPVATRAVLFPLYAFNVEVSRAPWVTSETMIAEMRLQWWRDALAEIRAGTGARRHEVVTPLARILTAEGAVLMDELVTARYWDIDRKPFENMDRFEAYIDRTSGHLLRAAALSLGGAPQAPLRAAGRAMGLAGFLRAVPMLERAGRVPLVDGRPDALRALAQNGLAQLAQARAARARIPAPVRPVLLALWQTEAILKTARAHPDRVARGRLAPAPLRARIGLIARALSGRW